MSTKESTERARMLTAVIEVAASTEERWLARAVAKARSICRRLSRASSSRRVRRSLYWPVITCREATTPSPVVPPIIRREVCRATSK